MAHDWKKFPNPYYEGILLNACTSFASSVVIHVSKNNGFSSHVLLRFGPFEPAARDGRKISDDRVFLFHSGPQAGSTRARHELRSP